MSIALNDTSQVPSVDSLLELQGFAFENVQPGQSYRIADKSFTLRRGWFEVASERVDNSELRVGGSLGAPGLWRTTVDPHGGVSGRLFEVPIEVLSRGACHANEISPALLRELVGWAFTTDEARVAADWAPPEATHIAAWAPPADLAVRAGAVVRQGHVVHEPRRLAARVPLTTTPLDAVPEVRAAWLRALLVDAQRQWRLVRFGSDTQNLVHAEVDLSGAPASVIEPLLRAAVATLRCAVRWLVRSVDFLVDTSARCRALEVLAP